MAITVIDFDGQIEDFPVLVQSVDNLVASGTRRLVLDLGTLEFINSAALGYLINVHKTLARHDGEVVLCRLRPVIQRLLEMTQLDTMLPAFDTAEEAVDYLRRDAAQEEVERPGWR